MADSKIFFECANAYFTETEIADIATQLRERNIDVCIDSVTQRYKASFLDIGIFLNDHLTEAIVMGLLIPTTYDIVKSSILAGIKAIRKKMKICQADKIRDADPYIKLQAETYEINILIPNDLSDDELAAYLDEAFALAKGHVANPEKRYEHFFIERDELDGKVRMKTMLEYGSERAAKTKDDSNHK